MKIILSRKGFDSANGGCASPILPDGTMLSMPICTEKNDFNLKYSEIGYEACKDAHSKLSYEEILKQIAPKKYIDGGCCHLDPDIRTDIIRPNIKERYNVEWVPAFGQVMAALSHLNNQNVGIGDLFLFFGWFRQCEFTDSKNLTLRYVKKSPDIQAVYGYLQIGDIASGDNLDEKVPWHPHSTFSKDPTKNKVYIASKKLIIDGVDTGLPGSGTFSYSDMITLTKDGMSRSKWKQQPWFKNLSYHSARNEKDDYFQSAKIGQEFVICDNPDAVCWARNLIRSNKK